MTKQQLIEIFDNAISNDYDYIAVAVETRGSKDIEIIIKKEL